MSNDELASSTRVVAPRDLVFFERRTKLLLAGGIIFVTTLMIFLTLQPSLIFRNNTPTGGDMGAHVYGPAYLRDHLLTSLRLSGWSNDWYSGLPIYRFYMVVPALFVLAFDVFLPYGIALKLVAIAGLLALPLCTWLFARLARLAFPIPELLVVASTVFLFDESFTIYGGNIASTMAGEFSFSIALAFAVLGFGVFWRGIETGGYRIAATILLALSALSHGIVLLFAFLGYLLILAMHKEPAKWKYGAPVIGTAVMLSAFWVLPFLLNHAYMTDMKYEPQPTGFGEGWVEMFFPLHIAFDVLVTGFALVGFLSALWRRSIVAAWLGIYGVILAIGVFVARESLPIIGLLWNPRVLPFFYLVRYLLMMIGIYETIVAIGRYVSLERAAARVAKSGEEQTLGPSLRGRLSFNVATALAVSFVCITIIGFRFQELPFASTRTLADGSQRYGLGPISVPASNDGFVDGWARWNFTGYEGKNAYGEYRALIETMKQIGEDPRYGCGRALWENNGETNKYGTTMGLMLLPHWTDGCIGSMEGLFFEASATTPYHFIAAAAMSKQSSNPVRELRYDDNKAALGVRYLQELGVRYYMGFTPEAVREASAQPALREIARSGPWVIYQVEASDLVVPLSKQPVVISGAAEQDVAVGHAGDAKERWLEVGTSWFQNPNDWVALPAADGPDEWQRVTTRIDLERRIGEPGESGRRVDIVVPNEQITQINLAPVVVTDVVQGRSSVSFSVDKVGVPVLVRTSYFPNWNVSGAKGPYRVAPNMMVVVPTSTDVRLSFGWSFLDILAYVVTIGGIVVLVRWRRRRHLARLL
ncbi:MAG: hypothetical protein EBQ57_04275 [Actinobacteria bacterium]|nr:hypothetical protein [Actinomycetota bacterium]NDE67188.1 hypothetical protein [Actinomycetota bacterium]